MISSVYWDRQISEKKLVEELYNMYGEHKARPVILHLHAKYHVPLVLVALGRHYRRRSPDPYNLVKSASVMTIASCLMLRVKEEDDAYMIDAEIEKLFTHALDICGAKGKRVGLHQLHDDIIFNTIREIPAISIVVVRREMAEFRKHDCLQGVKTLAKQKQEKEILKPIIKKLKGIAIVLHGMVKGLLDVAIRTVGEPPIKYHIIKQSTGGSTPFGDIEYSVILDNSYNTKKKQQKQKIMKYFRSVRLVMQMLVSTVRARVFPQLYLPNKTEIEKNSGSKWYYDCISPCEAICDPLSPFKLRHPTGPVYRMKRKTKFVINHIDTVDNSSTRDAETLRNPRFNLSHYQFAMILEKGNNIDADMRLFFKYFSNMFELEM